MSFLTSSERKRIIPVPSSRSSEKAPAHHWKQTVGGEFVKVGEAR